MFKFVPMLLILSPNKITDNDFNVLYIGDLALFRFLSFNNKLQAHTNPLVSNLVSSSIFDKNKMAYRPSNIKML